MTERVSVYIDGYNMYFGLRDVGWRNHLWLDVPAFAQSLLKEGQELIAVKYFTSRVSWPAASARRQGLFIEALQHRGGLEIVFGNFIYNKDGCETCGAEWDRREEKQTDVNIALHMVRDAYDDKFDAAILVSGDSDLVPVVRFIEQRATTQRVIAAFPPKRVSTDLIDTASAHFHLKRKAFANNQLPLVVMTGTHAIPQPVEWG